jgi:hypothetical protein
MDVFTVTTVHTVTNFIVVKFTATYTTSALHTIIICASIFSDASNPSFHSHYRLVSEANERLEMGYQCAEKIRR